MRGTGLQDFAQGYKKEGDRPGKPKNSFYILGMTEKDIWQHTDVLLYIYQHDSANSFQAQ